MGERRTRTAKVQGSIPCFSTKEVMRTYPRTSRDLSGPLHRKIRQGIGTPWMQLHRELREYADKNRLPKWQLRKAIEADVTRKPKFNEDGLLLGEWKKPAPPGTLYVAKNGILTKWVTPPEVIDEDETDLGYVQIDHPDHPKVLIERERVVGTMWARDARNGRTVHIDVRETFFRFYLEQHDGIWYEAKYRVPSYSSHYQYKHLIHRHQLNSRTLRRFRLSNQRAA